MIPSYSLPTSDGYRYRLQQDEPSPPGSFDEWFKTYKCILVDGEARLGSEPELDEEPRKFGYEINEDSSNMTHPLFDLTNLVAPVSGTASGIGKQIWLKHDRRSLWRWEIEGYLPLQTDEGIANCHASYSTSNNAMSIFIASSRGSICSGGRVLSLRRSSGSPPRGASAAN